MNHSTTNWQRLKTLYPPALRILSTLLLCTAVGAVFAGNPLRVQVKSRAEIKAAKILLGKIARIDGSDPGRVQRLAKVVIGRAPLPGKSRIIQDSYIKMRLRQSRVDLAGVQLQIPPQIVVSRSFIKISKERIKKIVADFIHHTLPVQQKSARLTNVDVAQAVVLPPGRVTYTVMPPRNSELLGKLPLSVLFSVNGHFVKRTWATVTIEMLADVVIAKRSIGRYKPISQEDIMVVQMDLAALPSNVITDPAGVIGKRAKRAIHARTPLRTDLVEFPPLVKRGDMVLIVVESAGLKITALGQVRRKGRRGERIPVVNLDSKKILYARVVDSHTVRVEF